MSVSGFFSHNGDTCNQYLRHCCLFKAMMRVIDALSTCVRHVGTFEDAPELEAIRSLPTCILKILKETFQHCKVGVIQHLLYWDYLICQYKINISVLLLSTGQ